MSLFDIFLSDPVALDNLISQSNGKHLDAPSYDAVYSILNFFGNDAFNISARFFVALK